MPHGFHRDSGPAPQFALSAPLGAPVIASFSCLFGRFTFMRPRPQLHQRREVETWRSRARPRAMRAILFRCYREFAILSTLACLLLPKEGFRKPTIHRNYMS